MWGHFSHQSLLIPSYLSLLSNFKVSEKEVCNMRTIPFLISHKKSPPQGMSHDGIDFYSPYIAQPVPIGGREDEDHCIGNDGERNACLQEIFGRDIARTVGDHVLRRIDR